MQPSRRRAPTLPDRSHRHELTAKHAQINARELTVLLAAHATRSPDRLLRCPATSPLRSGRPSRTTGQPRPRGRLHPRIRLPPRRTSGHRRMHRGPGGLRRRAPLPPRRRRMATSPDDGMRSGRTCHRACETTNQQPPRQADEPRPRRLQPLHLSLLLQPGPSRLLGHGFAQFVVHETFRSARGPHVSTRYLQLPGSRRRIRHPRVLHPRNKPHQRQLLHGQELRHPIRAHQQRTRSHRLHTGVIRHAIPVFVDEVRTACAPPKTSTFDDFRAWKLHQTVFEAWMPMTPQRVFHERQSCPDGTVLAQLHPLLPPFRSCVLRSRRPGVFPHEHLLGKRISEAHQPTKRHLATPVQYLFHVGLPHQIRRQPVAQLPTEILEQTAADPGPLPPHNTAAAVQPTRPVRRVRNRKQARHIWKILGTGDPFRQPLVILLPIFIPITGPPRCGMAFRAGHVPAASAFRWPGRIVGP